MKTVKSKASLQIVQAVLIMLAMVGGMLLLPGIDVRGEPGCATPGAAESGARAHSLQSLFSGSCQNRDHQD